MPLGMKQSTTALESGDEAESHARPKGRRSIRRPLLIKNASQRRHSTCVCASVFTVSWYVTQTPSAALVLPGCISADPYGRAAAFLSKWSPVVPGPVTTLEALLGHISEHLLQLLGGGTGAEEVWGFLGGDVA